MKAEVSLEQKAWTKRFIIIASAIIIFVVAACVTFAVFSDRITKQKDITFGKIELGEDTFFEIDHELVDIVPGDTLTEGEFKFVKDATSEPFYVRVKFAYSTIPVIYDNEEDKPSADRQALLDKVTEEYLTKLRKGTQYNLPAYADEDNEAVWTAKQGNYIYLVKASNNNEFYPITKDNTFYTVSTKITLPFFTLDQTADYTQASDEIRFCFTVSVQIVQARNLDHLTFNEIVSMFNTNFPEPDSQKYILYPPYDEADEEEFKEEFAGM